VVVKAHVRTIPLKYIDFTQGVSHTPSGGVNTPTFAQHPPASGGKEGERGRGGRGKGKRRGEGKGPPRLG